MLENSKIRVILEGKIVGHISKFTIDHDYEELFPTATIVLTNDVIIKTQLIGIDQVKENHLNNEGNSVSWVQYICKKI